MAISRDTKDWTWVLERPCDECGFDAAAFPPSTFADTIRENAASWARVLERADVGRRPDDETWSPLEYGCHVRDVYRIFNERLHLMLSDDNPVFQNWDQDQTALEERYELQNPAIVHDELLDAASAYADTFTTVTPTQWDRPGTRSNGSEFTVRSLGTYGLHDPFHHLWDVTST